MNSVQTNRILTRFGLAPIRTSVRGEWRLGRWVQDRGAWQALQGYETCEQALCDILEVAWPEVSRHLDVLTSGARRLLQELPRPIALLV
jgi:DNA-binding transcriptional ArsR family regulator